MPSVSFWGAAPRVTNIVLREQFTGNGSSTTFQLTNAPGNCTFNKGTWAASNIQTTYPAHCTGTDKKPTYDSVVIILRNRISVSSIDSSGLVTLDYAPRAGVDFYVWYWYNLQPIDEISYYREDFTASMEEEGSTLASGITPDTTNFNGILSASDTTVQAALDTIDDHLHDGQTLLCDGINSNGGAFSFTTSGTLTFSNTVNLTTCADAGEDTDKFLVLDSNGNIDYRTGAEVAADIGAGGGGNNTYIEWDDVAQVDSSGADLYVDFHGTDFTIGVVGNEANVSINFTRNWNLTTVGTHEYQIGGNRALAMPVDNTNIASGSGAGASLTTGTCNLLFGLNAGTNITEGVQNTAIGDSALATLTTVGYLVAIGGSALTANTIGIYNLAVGYQALTSNTGGNYNTAVGYQALESNIGGDYNLAIGYRALYTAEEANYNVAVGTESMAIVTSGENNVGVGYRALYELLTGSNNIAVGKASLPSVTSGSSNIGLGTNALYTLTEGVSNIALGTDSLKTVSTGDYNIAIGYQALLDATGSHNYAIGYRALYEVSSGTLNVSFGYRAGMDITTGGNNVSLGDYANYNNRIGNNNIAIGSQAIYGVNANSHSNNIGIGYKALYAVTTGGSNICIGYQAGDVITTGASNIIIGYDIDPSAAGASNELNIGGVIFGTLTANQNITINAVTVSANYDLMLAGDGVLGLKETTTPTADTNYGKIYCKNDDKLYFQDGAGVEHELAYA